MMAPTSEFAPRLYGSLARPVAIAWVRPRSPQNRGQHDRPRDQSHLPFELPSRCTAVNRQAVALPGREPVLEDPSRTHNLLAQQPLGFRRALPGLDTSTTS
jgi:hypothetical protein